MSDSTPSQPMDELEIRQDAVILQLDELNLRIEQVLAEWLSENSAAA